MIFSHFFDNDLNARTCDILLRVGSKWEKERLKYSQPKKSPSFMEKAYLISLRAQERASIYPGLFRPRVAHHFGLAQGQLTDKI